MLRNPFLEIGFATNSGAIISMESVGNQLNPLTFTLPREEPGRVPFMGHFICAPRWGDPGEAELANGSIKHGDISSQLWDIVKQTENCLEAEAVSETDGILVNKRITMAAGAPVVCIEDNLTNLSAVRRPGNLVQHPTIASPFLNANTRVDCSAAEALLHRGNGIEATACGTWPWVTDASGTGIDLRTPQNTSSAVYSFTSLQQPTSWITAFDPQSNLLLGYCWERSVYPWIHHWIYQENNQIKYRGLEFGTAGLHQPIDVIMRNNWHSWDRKCVAARRQD